MRTFNWTIKILSAITLFFFCWTFLPIYAAVAFAAERTQRAESKAQSADPSQSPLGKGGSRGVGQTSGERFEKALEAIREKIGQAEVKVEKSQDATNEVAEVKKQRIEIEKLDVDLKAEFAATEKKLKDAKLPKEILDRHAKFVKHYEDNLKELKTNLTGIEQSAKGIAFKNAIQKTKAHLEKTKAPSKHIPLDPNKLPNRMVKGKERAPRLKKKEFEKDFPAQKKQKTNFTAEVAEKSLASWYGVAAGFSLREKAKQEPILVASNGSLAGIVSSDNKLPRPSADSIGSAPEWVYRGVSGGFDLWTEATALPSNADMVGSLQNSELPTPNYQVAQAVIPPAPEDLAQTPEVQFTPDIQALAAQLNHSPVKIYEYVRNNIEYAPTYGSIQGADQCLQSKQCNDFDTASLLIALLRVSNVYAHYSYGTIEVPIDKVMNWAGGFTDKTSALNFIASGGVPITGIRSGGIVYAAQMEHVWVKAWIDYIPSFGAIQKQGNAWIPLDASFKQYSYTDGVDLQAAVPFNGQNLVDQIKATATINEQESYVTNVNSSLIQTALSDYNAQLDNYVTQNLPNATTGDILGKKEIIKKEQPILPASLPYKVIVAGTETSEVPDQLRHKITVQLTDADNPGSLSFTYTASLPQLAGKRFTVSYDPATSTDQTIINKYIEQYATSIPAYLVQFKPVLKIEGATLATGLSIGMGNAQNLTISITSPKGTEIVTHSLLAGDYTAIGLNPAKISLDVFQNRINKNDFSEPVGEMLHQTALSYWAEADAFNNVIAKTLRVNNFRHPSELAASAKMAVSYIWGVPSSAIYNRRNIDVKFDNQTVFSKAADKIKEINYMQQSGTTSSYLEGAIFDQLFGGNIGDSISAVTALKAANGAGIPIYKIDANNISVTLPKLQVADAIKNEISNAVNAGLSVQIPQMNITQAGWTGVGYVVSNPRDGSAAYRISGGLNGSDNNTGMNTVAAIPAVPIDGPVGFVVGAIAANGSRGLSLKVVGGVLEGFTLGPEVAAGLAVGAAEALIVLALIILIVSVVQSLMDKLPPRYEKYRKYTTESWAKQAWITREISTSMTGWFEGDLWVPGIYITDLMIEPVTEYNRVQIATILNIPRNGTPDPTRVVAYVDILIDRNRVGLISLPIVYPNQFLYPHIPMWEDGVRIKFTGIGPFLNP